MNNVTLLHGDCLDHLRALPTNSVDSVVTDPPAGIAFMGRDWDKDKGGRAAWVAWFTAIMAECYRVLKPGGHAAIWALPRTAHWTATAIEDAGFEIRDKCYHHFGSGFPKSKNVGNGIGTALKPAAEEWIIARKPLAGTVAATVAAWGTGGINVDACRVGTTKDVPASPKQVAPSAHTVSLPGGSMTDSGFNPNIGRWPPNVLLTHSAACRPVGTRQVRGANWRDSDNDRDRPSGYSGGLNPGYGAHYAAPDGTEIVPAWACAPDCPVAALDRQSGQSSSKRTLRGLAGRHDPGQGAAHNRIKPYSNSERGHNDTGGASRFFPVLAWDPAYDVPFAYVPKASRAERNAGCAGLDSTEIVMIQWNQPNTKGDSIWVPEDHAVALRVDTAQSRPRVIGAFTTQALDASAWNTFLFGNESAAPSLMGTKSIIVTGTNLITNSATLSWLTHSLTSAYTAGVNCSTGHGTSPAGNAGPSTPSVTITCAEMVSLPGVGNVPPGTQLTISASVNPSLSNPLDFIGSGIDGRGRPYKTTPAANFHPTVKPVALMRWLVRLVTPPGGTVLDPFLGSGTTGIAALHEGYSFIGCEQDADYLAIARARIAAVDPLFQEVAS